MGTSRGHTIATDEEPGLRALYEQERAAALQSSLASAEGRQKYEQAYGLAGLLDRDHLRFFTRWEIEKLLFRIGFTIEELRRIPGPGDDERLHPVRPASSGRTATRGC